MMIEDDDKGSTTIQHPRDYCQIFKLTFFHRLQPATRYVSSQKLAHSTWLLCMYVAFKSRPYSTFELSFFSKLMYSKLLSLISVWLKEGSNFFVVLHIWKVFFVGAEWIIMFWYSKSSVLRIQSTYKWFVHYWKHLLQHIARLTRVII